MAHLRLITAMVAATVTATAMAAATAGAMAVATAGVMAVGIAGVMGTTVTAIMDTMNRPFPSSFTVTVTAITTMNKAGRPWFRMA
ncbi:hypothetical protein [Methylobacterium sp. ID0610]|uniref:hypothetical protein n=1 Tax=Methylobacterium carpenticola TaxID=3344827 RepID=UPI0036950323